MKRGWQFGEVVRNSQWLLTGFVAALVVIGILFVRSASAARADPVLQLLYRRQLAWAAVGFFLYGLLAVVDYRRWVEMGGGLYGVALILLVLTLVMGRTIYGSRRWLNFFGFTLQPSELAKLAFLLVAVWHLSLPGTDRTRWKTAWVVLGLAAVPAALVLRQPDLGTALVFPTLAVVLLLISGFPWRKLLLLGSVAVLLILYLAVALVGPKWLGMGEEAQQRVFRTMTGMREYQWKRLTVFLDPSADPSGAGYNTRQSLLAVGAGGWRGVGYGAGAQSALGYLPSTVAPTDFIFSVIAEETGFLGAVLLLLLYFGVVGCGWRTAWRATDSAGRLLASGITAMVFLHVFINVGMTIGLLPVTGLPLPLVSYGGTFMLATLAGLGLLQSVGIHRKPAERL